MTVDSGRPLGPSGILYPAVPRDGPRSTVKPESPAEIRARVWL